jgi:hypothetical protein
LEAKIDLMSFTEEWEEFLLKASQHFKVMANDEFLLFVLGIQELGQGYKTYSKQEKMDLIALAHCKLMAMNGYMTETGRDVDGWPLYDVVKPDTSLSPSERDKMIRQTLMSYFKNIIE